MNALEPQALLSKTATATQDGKIKRGALKIFFGGNAGAGKTYAMLNAGRQRLAGGDDVVAGLVDTHERKETQPLLEGIPVLTAIERDGIREFDLDAALSRKPAVLLLDELGHSNPQGFRHPKRWNDVEELLAAGISVYTTLNVQQLESLSDLVTGITGVQVQETIPDSVFDKAEDVVLVDINADELLKRLHEGKLYADEAQRTQVQEGLLKKSSIIALRELALRRTAERVDAQMDALKTREGISGVQPVAEKVLVCVGPDPLSEKLIRSAKRMASSLKAPWIAVYIENARHYRLNEEGKKAVETHLRMAERLGGRTTVLQGTSAVDEIIAYAKENGVTKIVLGKSARPRLKDIIFNSLADKVIQKSGYIDVYVVTGGEAEAKAPRPAEIILPPFQPQYYGQGCALLIACTAFGLALRHTIKPEEQLLVYFTGNVIAAAALGRGPSILFALLACLGFNFFFTGNPYAFEFESRSFWMALVAMMSVSFVISSYSSLLRLQAMFARKRERNTGMLYAFTREIAATRGHRAICSVAAKHITEAVGAEIMVALPGESGQLAIVWGELQHRDIIKETGLMRWCFDNGKPAGNGTDTMPGAETFYTPLANGEQRLGVLGITPKLEDKRLTGEQLSLIETFATLLASAIGRANSAYDAERLGIAAESEKLRSALLSSVSHDLRAPLAAIAGASAKIAKEHATLEHQEIGRLAEGAYAEASRLARIVSNLLNIMSLEAGTMRLNMQPHFINELIEATVQQLQGALLRHQLETRIAPGLPMTDMDGSLIEQVVGNLLENAAQYTPPGSTVLIEATRDEKYLIVSICDNGPGIEPGDEKKIFDKFHTADRRASQKGAGLGLTICQGIIAAHGGVIWAENRPQAGAAFTFTLPLQQQAPI